MEYEITAEVAEKCNISQRIVAVYCKEERLKAAIIQLSKERHGLYQWI